MKYTRSFVVFNFAVICVLLALEWYETHGGAVIIPPKDVFFVILLVSPLTTVLYTLNRCLFHRNKVGTAV